MIRAVTRDKHGRTILVLGLTPGNLRLLEAGKVTLADGRQLMGCPVDVVLICNESHVDLVRAMREMGIELPAGAEAKAEGLPAMVMVDTRIANEPPGDEPS